MKLKTKNVFIFLCMLLPTMVFSQTKRILIVAIGDYPAETKWRTINSLNDVPLIESAFQKQGFTDFKILKNEQADKKGIVQAIQDLERRSELGDVIVLHFSSHGQRIADDNGDELDGYDEAIVAYGAPAFFSKDYKDDNHLRDDQIETLIESLRRKVGPNGDVLMIADACHSGTISRGEISRGGMPPMEDPNNPPMARGQEDVGLFQQTAVSRGSGGDLSPFVLISASQASQVNYEYQGAGSLSTAISRCASKIDNNMSYRSYFAQILKEMSELAPNQIPAIEGDIDRTLFAGRLVAQQNYYTAYKVRDLDMNLNGGTLNGLNNDTEIAIFPAGTQNTKDKTPLSIGKVVNAEGTWSKAKLTTPLTGKVTDYWVFVTKQTYGDITVRVKLDMGNSQANESLKAVFTDYSLVKLVSDKPDFTIVDGGRGAADIIRFSDSSTFAEDVSLEDNADGLKQILLNYARGKHIKELDLSYNGINVSFEFIPLRVEVVGSQVNILDTLTIAEISTNGVLGVNENIGVHIKVTNSGTQPAYFAILDIQPNGVINGIVPDPNPARGHMPDQFKIAPNTTFIIPDYVVTFGPPFGAEVFKLFASKDVIDFKTILSGQRTRSAMSDFEMLFSDAMEAATRGGTPGAVNSSMEASTFSISFQIQPTP